MRNAIGHALRRYQVDPCQHNYNLLLEAVEAALNAWRIHLEAEPIRGAEAVAREILGGVHD